MADPIDDVLVDNVDVAKAGLRSYDKSYVELRVATPAVIQNNNFTDRSGGIYVRSVGSHYEVDLADRLTDEDVPNVIIDDAGNRWKAIDGHGTATIDFGAFPGSGDASVDITGLAGIAAGAVVSARIRVADSADHTADEHAVDPPMIEAGNVVAGVGFTIYGRARADGEDVSGVWNLFFEWKN